ncbi:MAG TPA: hypothetical protein PKE64_31560, partial [Anaerolineae bacterium]|nr:hypothetical protein [Anaerolineae bacterium]
MKISAGESLNAVSETALLTLKAKGLEAEKGDPVITTEVGKQSLANLQARLPLETRTRLLNRRLPTSLARYLALRAR